jgi:hypothetical protein
MNERFFLQGDFKFVRMDGHFSLENKNALDNAMSTGHNVNLSTSSYRSIHPNERRTWC